MGQRSCRRTLSASSISQQPTRTFPPGIATRLHFLAPPLLPAPQLPLACESSSPTTDACDKDRDWERPGPPPVRACNAIVVAVNEG